MKNAENVYVCQSCGGYTSTIDIDEGVTPFIIDCRATKRCGGTAYSSFYPKGPRPDHIPEPSWEWYRPDAPEYAKLDRATREQHVDHGGLLLRRRSTVAPTGTPGAEKGSPE